MKKCLTFLLLLLTVWLLPINVKADEITENYGNHMTYVTLDLFFDFELYTWWSDDEQNTIIFALESKNDSLTLLMALWENRANNFMELYFKSGPNIPYSNGYFLNGFVWSWFAEDGTLYLIADKNEFQYPDNPLYDLADYIEVMRLNTWIVTDGTEGYEEGYEKGYEDGQRDSDKDYLTGYREGYDLGFADGESGAYDRGYSDGYDIGYDYGYSAGQVDEFNGLTIITTGIFGFLSVIGNFQLLPGFKVGHLVGITMFFGLIYFIIGKRR